MSALGKMFSDHCRKRSFDFDYCDVLAGKGQVFYDLGGVGLKADIAIGMLILGLDHNRWFVERKFLQMVSPAVSSDVIKRMIVELSVLEIDFNYEFFRMRNSIAAKRSALHPELQELVTDEV